jgi:hypothetical protein
VGAARAFIVVSVPMSDRALHSIHFERKNRIAATERGRYHEDED